MGDNSVRFLGREAERGLLLSARRCSVRACVWLPVLAVLVAACDNGESFLPQPEAVQINGPGQVTLPAQASFTALEIWSDGSTRDVTGAAQWTSTNPSVLSVSAGLATALAAGEGGLTAAFGRHTSERRTVLVIPAMPEWNGTYTLTIGGGACTGTGSMPPELRQRTFTAVISQEGLMLSIVIAGAGGFAGRIINPETLFFLGGNLSSLRSRVTLQRIVATREPPVDLSPYRRVAYWGPVGEPTLVEVLPDGNRLSFSGQAVTTMSPSGFTGILNGELRLSDRTGGGLATCSSPSHAFALART